ncbi:MAG TPA: YciI family protein [Ktedonobacterales bacterium]
MHFLLTFYSDDAAWLALPEERRAELGARIGAWYGTHAGAGHIIEGRRLHGRESATTVELGAPGAGNAPVTRPGPFAPGAEAMGSYAVIEAPDAAAALAIAHEWPGGGSVEVRPVVAE